MFKTKRGRPAVALEAEGFTSAEVARISGVSLRQLQWWDRRGVFPSAIPSHKTAKGGFTERRYTPIELLELMVLADLRRRGFSIPAIRRLLEVLRTRFKVRLFEAIEGGGPLTLFIDGHQIFARTESGELYNMLENPTQPLLMVGEDLRLRQLVAREQRPTKRRTRQAAVSKLKPSSA